MNLWLVLYMLRVSFFTSVAVLVFSIVVCCKCLSVFVVVAEKAAGKCTASSWLHEVFTFSLVITDSEFVVLLSAWFQWVCQIWTVYWLFTCISCSMQYKMSVYAIIFVLFLFLWMTLGNVLCNKYWYFRVDYFSYILQFLAAAVVFFTQKLHAANATELLFSCITCSYVNLY